MVLQIRIYFVIGSVATDEYERERSSSCKPVVWCVYAKPVTKFCKNSIVSFYVMWLYDHVKEKLLITINEPVYMSPG